ncbi:hypothetical protein SAMN04488007_0135 [Maribacter aquivivus]|uniref:DUF4168 domain-containing protein n=1 Tax=Maribacter aquivivus TaxID=228958 RepID=A0A1M6IT58_9FLAO|nr:hypothetical protein [Maribacter aquivivus]SHJ37585.1 hypothetical protein SAMN04488007_0135 [Maribacter aquivivus]
MKNRIIVTLALTAILNACSSTKKTTSNNTEATTEQMNTAQIETKAKSKESSGNESAINQKSTTEHVNASTDAMNNVATKNSLGTEYSKMFTALEMSENQISIFKSSMERFKTKQANLASGEMLGSIESERTRQMESILSSAQYAKYEQWLADNQ